MKTRPIWTARDQDRADRQRWENSPAGRRETASLQRQEEARRQRAHEDLILAENPEVGALQRASGRAFYIFQDGAEVEAPLAELVALLAPRRQAGAQAIIARQDRA